jgi:hypothetical protein
MRLARGRSASNLGSDGGVGEGTGEGSEGGGALDKEEGEGGTDEAYQQQHQQISQLKAKLREQDQIIAAAKHKEVLFSTNYVFYV